MITSTQHEALFQDLVAALGKYPDITPEQMLAIAANLVGKLIAMQDQRKYSPLDVMECVKRNIALGNAQAVAGLSHPQGRA